MPTNKLKITIEEESGLIPFDAFLTTISHTVRILRGMDKTISRTHQPTARWAIADVTMHSPLQMTLEPVRALPDTPMVNVIDPFLEDIGRLDCGQATRHMSPRDRDLAKKLVGTLGRGISAITFASNGTAVRPTQRVAARVDELRQKQARFRDTGSIEGQLDVISVHGRESATIYDARSGQPIICNLSTSQLESAKESLGKRVIIRGIVQYVQEQPRDIVDVFDIRILRDRSALPQPDRIGPIDFGDVEPADYLRGPEEDD